MIMKGEKDRDGEGGGGERKQTDSEMHKERLAESELERKDKKWRSVISDERLSSSTSMLPTAKNRCG